jgi:aspartate aminotransferase
LHSGKIRYRGIAFGADDYIRLSYATSMANLEKGLERIERFCKGLAR